MTQRACVDCRHYIPRTVRVPGRCKLSYHFSLELGRIYHEVMDNRDGACGPEAKLFARRGNWFTRLFTDGEG